MWRARIVGSFGMLVPTYHNTLLLSSAYDGISPIDETRMATTKPPAPIERVQTGVRVEKRLLKVLKGLAETLDLSLGDLIEGMSLHALDNKLPFSPATLRKAADLKRVNGHTLTADDSHKLRERA
jgi:hypothetical protein